MDIDKFIETKGEGLKRIGAIVCKLNEIESVLIGSISSFFIFDFTDAGKNKSIILNDLFRESKVFSSMENKRILIKKVIEKINKIAIKKSATFNLKKYLLILKDIQKMQEIRNKLAHNLLNFSEDGSLAFYINSDRETIEINLDNVLIELEKISKNSYKLLDEFFPESQTILLK